MRRSVTDRLQRFSTDAPSGCRLWIGAKDNRGYGRIYWRGQNHLAHRVAFQVHWGRSLGTLDFVCHHCDTPACIRIEHLFCGSPADNMRDMMAKGRGRFTFGSANSNTKLTREQVADILCDSASHSNIAARYGVAQTTISDIKRGKTWRSIWLDVTRSQPGSNQAGNVSKSSEGVSLHGSNHEGNRGHEVVKACQELGNVCRA